MKALHRLALFAYPRAFRHQFGDELQGLFERRVAARRERSAVAALLIAAFLLADAVISGLAQRFRQAPDLPGSPSSPHRGRSVLSWDSIRRDLAYAMRQFGRTPGFAVLTVGSLALGIGASTAIFAVVHSVLLRPLPYEDPDALVTIWSHNTRNDEPNNPVSPANFEAFRSAPSLAAVEGLYSFLTPAQVRFDGEPEPVLISQITPGMFTLLGRSPAIGRTFGDSEAPDGAVLSHAFWQRRFGGDPDVIGRTMIVGGAGAAATVPILGVMPEDFTFPYGSMLAGTGFTRSVAVDMWWPISRQRDSRLVDATGQPNRAIHYFGVVARLAPGVTIERARADLETIATVRAQTFPDTNEGWGVTVRPLHEQTVGRLRPALLLLLAGVVVVLLITCMNVANVLLARAAGRGRDLAIRSALGASGGRLVQQTLIESLLLSTAGGLAGLGFMSLALGALLAAAPANLPRIAEVSSTWPVVVFAMALSLASGIGVGIIPALSAARSRAGDSLRDGVRTTASRTRQRTRAALIVAEVALAMILTVGCGLLLRSFISVLSVDPGFKSDHLLTMQVAVPARVAAGGDLLPFYDQLESRLRALPGVTAVGGTTRLPLGSTSVTTYLEIEGRPLTPSERPEVEMRRAVFDYFTAMGIPTLRGRTFTADDRAGGPAVAVVNQALAARLFPGDDPVGRRVRFASSQSQTWMTIVGVVGNVRHLTLEETPKPEIYMYYRQGPPVGPFLVLRTAGDPAELADAARAAIRRLGADPPRDVRTMEAIRGQSVAMRRFILLLVGSFGVLALALAALGVFGVVTLIAAERTTEVGVRLALGATPRQVLGMVVGQALRLAGFGVVLGVIAALAVAPFLESQLFGVGAIDPLTYATVAFVLLITAALGASVPARRAMRVDPAAALRT